MSENHPVNDYIAGAIGGSAGLIAGHPLDTTKVQIQTQLASSHYTSTLDCIKNVHKQGWVRGFFRGMSWPVISYGAVNSVFFGVYGNTLNFLHRHNNGGEGKPRFWEIYMAGCVGGAAQLVIACPIDLVKVVLQSQIPHGTKAQPSSLFTGPLQAATHILKSHNIRGLYKGLPIQAVRDIPASGTYFASFELMNVYCERHFPAIPLHLFHFISGGIAGVLSWLIILPLDVIKSRYQADQSNAYRNALHCAAASYREEGLGFLFRGLTAMCLRAFVVNGVTLGVYGYCIRHLNKS